MRGKEEKARGEERSVITTRRVGMELVGLDWIVVLVGLSYDIVGCVGSIKSARTFLQPMKMVLDGALIKLHCVRCRWALIAKKQRCTWALMKKVVQRLKLTAPGRELLLVAAAKVSSVLQL